MAKGDDFIQSIDSKIAFLRKQKEDYRSSLTRDLVNESSVLNLADVAWNNILDARIQELEHVKVSFRSWLLSEERGQ